MKKNLFLMVILGLLSMVYIRYQQIDIEIARFDYMMRVMKEEESRHEE